jgi:hypothetical protein
MRKITTLMLGFAMMSGTATAVLANVDKHEKKDDRKKH